MRPVWRRMARAPSTTLGGCHMIQWTKVSVAIVCALGVTAAIATAVGTTTAGTVVFVGMGAAAVAGAASDANSSTVTHTP